MDSANSFSATRRFGFVETVDRLVSRNPALSYAPESNTLANQI